MTDEDAQTTISEEYANLTRLMGEVTAELEPNEAVVELTKTLMTGIAGLIMLVEANLKVTAMAVDAIEDLKNR